VALFEAVPLWLTVMMQPVGAQAIILAVLASMGGFIL
jgi:hypothetical protein